MILFLPRPLFSILFLFDTIQFFYSLYPLPQLFVSYIFFLFIYVFYFFIFLLSDYFGSRDPKTKRNEEQKKLNGDLQWMHKCSEFIFFYSHHLLVTSGELGIFIYSSIIKNYFAHTISSHSDFLIIQKLHFWYRTNNTLCTLYPHYLEFYQVKQKKTNFHFSLPLLSFFLLSSFPIFASTEVKKSHSATQRCINTIDITGLF